ncbi:MAG TPA: endonuclease/exonuclease/phosphatase family protein [Candidatus Didemnitutus sp.]|nr:endonuclease/exonuclease/phosphatase family protein [Candidatus Didemnitutus sp.]
MLFNWRGGVAFVIGGIVAVTVGAKGADGSITLATYNVENYVRASRIVDGIYRPDYPKPEAEKAALRRVIAGLSADVLALQEMGPPPYLEELRQDLRAEGIDYPYSALVEAADADRHVAILARIPWQSLQRHEILVTGFAPGARVKRGVLEARFSRERGDFTIFVVHLKSQLTETGDDPASARQRRAEAAAVRDLVLVRFPEPEKARFIVCGDWNDSRDSDTVRIMLRRGANRLGVLLPAADSRGETWTHHFLRADSYSRLDYFLVSPGWSGEIADSRATIYDGPGTLIASDHRPVFVRIIGGRATAPANDARTRN